MLWMPLALGHSHGALRAPSSSNRVRPVNHSQAWGYGRRAQKELLGNKFSGTSEPVNTVSEFTVAFFFFSFKESFPGSKAITEESKKNKRNRQHKKSRILLRLKLIPNVIFLAM